MSRKKAASQLGFFDAGVRGPVVPAMPAVAARAAEKVEAIGEGLTGEARSLLERFEVVAEAPGGVKRLRELVLELAVRGRLVEQLAGDGVASALLKAIDEERTGLGLQTGAGVEMPNIALPLSWTWTVFGRLLVFGPKNGYSPVAVSYSTGVKSLTLSATTSGTFDATQFKYIDEEIERASPLWLQDGDILIQRGNTRDYVGVAAVYRGNPGEFIYPDLMMKARLSELLNIAYVHKALNSSFARRFIQGQARGTSSSMVKINQAVVEGIPLPLPPLAEQLRIVAKVDALMALCDDLEARLKEQREAATRMGVAALAGLVSAEGPEELAEGWERVARQLEGISAEPAAVGELKKSVLELAVRGRLVEQDPREEAASVLLASIAADADAAAPSPPATPPFVAPATWAWSTGDVVFTYVTSGSRGWAQHYSATGPIFLRIGNLDYGTTSLDLRSIQRVNPPTNAEGTRTRVQPGDILISITGDTGMVGLVPSDLGEAYINQHIALARPSKRMHAPFVAIQLTAPFSLGRLQNAQRGIKNSLGLEDIRRMGIAVPPLAEQRRIVAKVDTLLALCNDLEAALLAEEDAARRLADALLADVLT